MSFDLMRIFLNGTDLNTYKMIFPLKNKWLAKPNTKTKQREVDYSEIWTGQKRRENIQNLEKKKPTKASSHKAYSLLDWLASFVLWEPSISLKNLRSVSVSSSKITQQQFFGFTVELRNLTFSDLEERKYFSTELFKKNPRDKPFDPHILLVILPNAFFNIYNSYAFALRYLSIGFNVGIKKIINLQAENETKWKKR